MNDLPDALPEIIGHPPTSVHSSDDLSPDTVAVMLTAPSAPALLERLGITGQDAEEIVPLLPRAAADREILTEITRTANLLRARAGLKDPAVDFKSLMEHQDTLQQRLAPGVGLLSILALAVSTNAVRVWHEARGLTAAQSWEVLADLGQQMRVHRRATGQLGLHQQGWMALNWRGRLVHLGRLQFDLHRVDEGTALERWGIGVHIPAVGPLDPTSVEESFAHATEFFTTYFGDLDADRPAGAPPFGREFHCSSWLMNPVLVQSLGAESNIGAFVDRWEIVSRTPGEDAAVFFVFNQLPPYDATALPRTTRLERTVAERLADGRGWEGGVGRLVR